MWASGICWSGGDGDGVREGGGGGGGERAEVSSAHGHTRSRSDVYVPNVGHRLKSQHGSGPLPVPEENRAEPSGAEPGATWPPPTLGSS